MNPPPYRLELFREPVLASAAGPVAGRAAHRRRIAVLAVLALARRRPVGRDRLMGLLWPEHSSDAARHNLSESLYVLRKEMGEGAITASGTDVVLSPEVVACDAAEFEDAVDAGDHERAAALYAGPLLDGFYVPDAPEFERWVEGERDRLARAFARVAEELAERAEGEGSALGAVEWWRRLAGHDPFSSRVALRLIRALDAAGERGAALRHAEVHAALLRDELGVERDPELEALVARLRAEPVRTPAPPPPPAYTVGVAAGTELPEAPGTPAPPRSAQQQQQPQPRHGRWAPRGALAGAVAGVLLALARGGTGDVAPEPPSAPDPRRIAVLYFDDHSPGESHRHLAAGLTESLIHELSQVEALEVVSRNGVKPYRDAAAPFDSVIAALGAGSVVEGSLQRSGDSLFVTVQLIDAATQAHLESRVVARPMGDLVALQRAVAEEVAASLRRRLGAEVRLREARAETRSPEALALLLRAEALRDDAARMATERDPRDAAAAAALLARADSLLARAEAADPAWSRPALLRGWLAMQRAERLPRSEGARIAAGALARAGRVLARAPDDAGALELRGYARFWSAVQGNSEGGEALEAAERDLRAAVAAEPGLASAWSRLSQLLRYRGSFAEADLAARRALAEDAYLDGAADILHRLYASALAVGDHAEALAWCDRGRARFPADWRLLECRLTLLRDDPAGRPDPARAWALVAELERLDPSDRARAAGRPYSPVYRRTVAAAISARAGDDERARAEVARARREVAGSRDLRLSLAFDEAYVRVVLGEPEIANRLLDSLVTARPALRDYVARDPLFRSLARR